MTSSYMYICFHDVCEAVSGQIMCLVFVKVKNNLDGCLTNMISVMKKMTL